MKRKTLSDRQKEFSSWHNDKRNLLRNLQANGEINKTGWTQDIAIEPGKTYMFGTMAEMFRYIKWTFNQDQFKGQR